MTEKSVKLTGSVSSGILDKLVLRQANIRESFSTDSLALLIVDSPNQNLSPEDFLGETLCLEIKTTAGKRYYHGIVVSMAHLHDTHASKTRYQLSVSSWTELLHRNQDFWIYQNKSIPTIIEEVFKRNGRGGSEYSLAGLSKSYPPLEYCVQFGETDANFVRRLMEQEGIYFYFKHEAGSHTLMLVDHAGHHQALPLSLLWCRVRLLLLPPLNPSFREDAVRGNPQMRHNHRLFNLMIISYQLGIQDVHQISTVLRGR